MEQRSSHNLAIIGASYLQLPLIEKAKEMGFTTHVFAWEANDPGEKAADFFYPVSIIEKEEICEICRRTEICGVCSIASDLAGVTVNYVAHELNLTGNSPECTRKCTNKYEMRKTFAQHGDPCPEFYPVSDPDNLPIPHLSFPVIVKPTDRSGSRGVSLVYDHDGLKDAVKTAIGQSFEKRALIEEFVQGTEYSLEGISWKGEHCILAMTRKFTTGAPHFIETGHMQPAGVDDRTFARACAAVTHALDSLGILYGASHSEIRIAEDGKIHIIEIGARMGGDCIGSDLVPLTTGVDYVKAVILTACGIKPDLTPQKPGTAASVRYIFDREDEERMQQYIKTHPEKTVKQIYLDRSLFGRAGDSSQRAGCYLISE